MQANESRRPRKAYAKPRIAVEEFTLNQFIANCSVNAKKSNWREQLAQVSYFDYVHVMRTKQFAEGMDCDVHADVITDNMDTLCYHTATSPLFGS